jgi:hypothetical protein
MLQVDKIVNQFKLRLQYFKDPRIVSPLFLIPQNLRINIQTNIKYRSPGFLTAESLHYLAPLVCQAEFIIRLTQLSPSLSDTCSRRKISSASAIELIIHVSCLLESARGRQHIAITQKAPTYIQV